MADNADPEQMRSMVLAGLFYTALVGAMVWQILRLLSRGGLDAQGVLRLGVSVFVLGIMGYVGYTMLQVWT